MLAFYCDDTELDLPPGHRFPAEKYRMLRDQVARHLPRVRLQPAEPVSEEQLLLAHGARYVKAVLDGSLDAAQQREIGFRWSPGMVLRSLRSVGATWAAARAALEEGVAVNLAGGTHHAAADRGSGFCVFNDVVVAARCVQQAAHRGADAAAASRDLPVAVIDLDVHQGDGTATLCADDPDIFTLSMHGEKNFPFRKAFSDLDVELPDGCGDERYLDELDHALTRMWTLTWDRPPKLLFYLAGCDVHQADRLGRLKLSAEGIRERDRRVLDAAQERGIPVVVLMAGGYGRDLRRMVEMQLDTVREAARGWERAQERADWGEACGPGVGLIIPAHGRSQA